MATATAVNFTVKLKNGQQQEVDPFINVATRKVRQSPKTAALTKTSKKGKESNRDSVASQRKQKRDGIRKSLHIIVAPSVDNEVHGNKVQHAAPSAAEHRAKIEQIDAFENDFLRDLQGFQFGEAGWLFLVDDECVMSYVRVELWQQDRANRS